MNSNKPIVPKPIAPNGVTPNQNGQPLFSQPRHGSTNGGRAYDMQHIICFISHRTSEQDQVQGPSLRPSHHLRPGRPKVIVKPNIQVKNLRNIQPGKGYHKNSLGKFSG